MRQDFFNFRPQFTLIIVGNHKPSLRTVDDAIRRRFHLVPFTVSIPDTERDPGLKEAFRAEADAIVGWALEGCLQWQRQRLNPPSAVLEATREYLEEEDVLGAWIDECCEQGPEYTEASALLFASYRCWKERHGEQVPSQKKFSRSLTTKHGFRRVRSARERMIAGLKLTDVERAAATNPRRNRQRKRSNK
jgi:P4 family phage/plasmid primase-like protien